MKLLNGLLVVAFVSMLAISCKETPAPEVVEEAPAVEEVAVDTTVVADTVAVAEEVVAQ